MKFLWQRAALAFFVLVICGPKPARAQLDYPNRRINVIVPYPAGGIVDNTTRIITGKLSLGGTNRTFTITCATSASPPITCMGVSQRLRGPQCREPLPTAWRGGVPDPECAGWNQQEYRGGDAGCRQLGAGAVSQIQ